MRYVVGVMGPAKARRKDVENARALGELIARREWVLLTGGRDVGVMHAANQGAKKVPRSLTVGVLPTTRDRISKYVDVAVITEMGNARNNVCVLSSQVIIACGLGGSGTVSEVALALKAGGAARRNAHRRKIFQTLRRPARVQCADTGRCDQRHLETF